MLIPVLKHKPNKFIKLNSLVMVFGLNLKKFDPLIGKYSPHCCLDLYAKYNFKMMHNTKAPSENISAAGNPSFEM